MANLIESDYRNIYYAVIVAVFIMAAMTHRFLPKYRNGDWAGVLIVFIGLFYGLRPLDIGTDTVTYSIWFSNLQYSSEKELLEYFTLGGEPFFRGLFFITGKIGTYSLALVVICLLFNGLNFYFCKIVNKELVVGSALLLFLFSLSGFTTYGEQVNIIRAGLGSTLFCICSYYIYLEKKIQSLLWGILAVGCHFSTAIFIGIILIQKYSKVSLKWCYIAYFAALLLSMVNFSVLNFGFIQGIDFEKAQSYTQNIAYSDYQTGFRPTFALYNTFFLGVFYYLSKGRHTQFFDYYLKFYLLSSALFFLWFAIPFSDRVGAFSWAILPLLLYCAVCLRWPRKPVTYGIAAFFCYAAINYFI